MVNNFRLSPPDKSEIYQNCPDNVLISALPDESWLVLVPFFEKITLTAGQIIYEANQTIDFVYFPETAVVCELQVLADGRALTTALIGNEGALGLTAALDSVVAANWAQVLADGSAARISAEVVKTEAERNPALQEMFLGYLNNYIGEISRHIPCNMYHSLEQRFADWLAALSRKSGTRTLPLTQEQIANYLGTHRPSLSNVAADFQRRRIIEYRRGHLTILDLPELEKLACGCYARAAA